MLTNLINVPVIKVNKEKVKRKESILSFLIYEWLPKRKRNKKKEHGLFRKVRGYKASTWVLASLFWYFWELKLSSWPLVCPFYLKMLVVSLDSSKICGHFNHAFMHCMFIWGFFNDKYVNLYLVLILNTNEMFYNCNQKLYKAFK